MFVTFSYFIFYFSNALLNCIKLKKRLYHFYYLTQNILFYLGCLLFHITGFYPKSK